MLETVRLLQGDCVEWEAKNVHLNEWKTLHGTVIAVVPPGEHPHDVVPVGFSVRPDLGGVRKVESYLVVSYDSSYGPDECLWPIANKLRLTRRARSC